MQHIDVIVISYAYRRCPSHPSQLSKHPGNTKSGAKQKSGAPNSNIENKYKVQQLTWEIHQYNFM